MQGFPSQFKFQQPLNSSHVTMRRQGPMSYPRSPPHVPSTSTFRQSLTDKCPRTAQSRALNGHIVIQLNILNVLLYLAESDIHLSVPHARVCLLST